MSNPLVTPAEKLEYSLVMLRYLRDFCNTTQIPQLAALAQGLNAVDLSSNNATLGADLIAFVNGPLRQVMTGFPASSSTSAVQFGVVTA